MSRGLTAHTHGGTLSQFSLHFVKTGLVPIEYGGFFSRMVQLRQKADYKSIAEVSEEEARSIVSMSHTFCDKVIELSSLDMDKNAGSSLIGNDYPQMKILFLHELLPWSWVFDKSRDIKLTINYSQGRGSSTNLKT